MSGEIELFLDSIAAAAAADDDEGRSSLEPEPEPSPALLWRVFTSASPAVAALWLAKDVMGSKTRAASAAVVAVLCGPPPVAAAPSGGGSTFTDPDAVPPPALWLGLLWFRGVFDAVKAVTISACPPPPPTTGTRLSCPLWAIGKSAAAELPPRPPSS